MFFCGELLFTSTLMSIGNQLFVNPNYGTCIVLIICVTIVVLSSIVLWFSYKKHYLHVLEEKMRIDFQEKSTLQKIRADLFARRLEFEKDFFQKIMRKTTVTVKKEEKIKDSAQSDSKRETDSSQSNGGGVVIIETTETTSIDNLNDVDKQAQNYREVCNNVERELMGREPIGNANKVGNYEDKG